MRPFARAAWAASITDDRVALRHLGAFELQQLRESKPAGSLRIVMQLSHEGIPVLFQDDGAVLRVPRTVINRMKVHF